MSKTNSTVELEFIITNRLSIRRSRNQFSFTVLGEISPMRLQLLFSVFMGIAISGCGNFEHSLVPQNSADPESPEDLVWHEVPYHLVETKPDGTQVVQYAVEFMKLETQLMVDNNGQEEARSVMVPAVEELIATVPPGEDISQFLSGYVDGRIVNQAPSAHFDELAEPAPAPPAD
jgi:hypothetical protein